MICNMYTRIILKLLQNQYDSANAELERLNAYKVQVAQREHVELASTIRQRLINTITKKRDRLMREKEQLDIADSNSLLMHPGHYSLNVPSSPGGLQSNRKTRHTRLRPGDPEEVLLERGRKRKLPGDDDGNESPMPAFRPFAQDANGAASPFQDQRSKVLRAQQEAPAYSIDSIFTEKELAHATTAAQFATHHFFNLQMQNADQNSTTQTNGKPADSNNESGENGVSTQTDDRPATPFGAHLESAGMERQVSNYATRGAAKANPLSFLSDAAMLAGTGIEAAVVNPYLPLMIPITKTDKGAPTPSSASARDINHDLAMIIGEDNDIAPPARLIRPVGDAAPDGDVTVAEARKSYLEQVCREPVVAQPFRLPLTDLGPAMIKDGVNRPAIMGFADPASMTGLRDGNAGMAASSAAGFPSLAGAAMSRTTSQGGSEMGASEGGAAMRRTRSRAV